MSFVKCLCKIGVLQSEIGSKNINDYTFKHNSKLYKPLIDLNFIQLAQDISENADFCLVGLKSDNDEYCTIFHDATRRPGKNLESRARIMRLVFPDFTHIYSTAKDVDDNEDDKVAKLNYVTSKLFDLLRLSHQSEILQNYKIDDTRLNPTLRNYQQNTIKWLLHREQTKDKLNNFCKQYRSTEGVECHINMINLFIEDQILEDVMIPSGGILADEMGLGKTVEMLALILSNPRSLPEIPTKTLDDKLNEPINKKPRTEIDLFCLCNSHTEKNLRRCSKCLFYQHKKCVRSFIDAPLSDDGSYVCPKCWEKEGTLTSSAATVIVSPSILTPQWLSELNKHINPQFNVLIYEGVTDMKISPKELASYDVILTDYNVLKKEVRFTPSNDTNISFRNKRRSMRLNSPLLLVEWWRVCLDEAQMQSSATLASKLVRQLPAIHRWAVTGTPIQRSLDDLCTLLDFIGLRKITCNEIWQPLRDQFTGEHTENMINILKKIMWRTCKSNVLEELGIPPQIIIVHFIELNNVEYLFYSDDHADSVAAFHEKIKNYSNLTRVTPKILNSILQPMLKLRQDCNIPVLYSKSETSKPKYLQPQELIEHMKSTNELECKAQLRTMACSYNGLAGLYFLNKEYKNAIKYYELVIKFAKDYTGAISVDTLLQIHALYNVIQAYRISTINDSSLIEEYEEQYSNLEWKYLQPYALNLQSAHNGYSSALKALNETDCINSTNTWSNILCSYNNSSRTMELINKVNDEVFSLHSNALLDRFFSTNAILLVLDIWYQKIFETRRELSKVILDFEIFIKNVKQRKDITIANWRLMNSFIQSVSLCHLSSIREDVNSKKVEENSKKKKICKLCEMEKLLQKYECLIYDKVVDNKTETTEGTRNPTIQESILKAINMFVRLKPANEEVVRDSEKQLEAISFMKTEYNELVKLWIEIEYTVKAYDELDMCKMRITLIKNPIEKTKYNILHHEIDDLMLELQMVYFEAQKEFEMKKARLRYICHLEKGYDAGPCPICSVEDQNKYVVLECGHHMCLFCLKTMSKIQNKTNKLNCSVCRHQQKISNVHYVIQKNNNETQAVMGDYSSKIHNIVSQILKLKSEDENVKIIIFSTWEPVLKVIGDALKENSIKYCLKGSQRSIKEFKDESLDITCLLMILSKGSQGLNLIEATHVFLVEPILNLGEELQAIGRIHRIGQTKPTFVHRFIVKNTIEENIYNTVIKEKSTKYNNLTIDRIKKLFEYVPRNM